MISTACIESLIPDFLMESGHFFLFVADVEGNVMRFNKGFERINSNPLEVQFSEFLSPASGEEFNYSLELMLGSPKIRRHLMLDHPHLQTEGFSQVWWEFSVVTTPEMDISGIIGIGVGMQFLEQEMPWNNLVDVLGFGEILLDKDLNIKSWDDRILNWFDPKSENWSDANLFDVFSFQDFNHSKPQLAHLLPSDKPKCFILNKKFPTNKAYASLLTITSKGYHLFLMPKAVPFYAKQEKPLIPSQTLSLFPGAVFVLNQYGELLQQNEAAKSLGKTWKGKEFQIGFTLGFPDQPKRFSKFLKAIEDARGGQSSELDLKMLMPNQEFAYWEAVIKPISDDFNQTEGILVQILDRTSSKSQLINLQRENDNLRDLALRPSHILRGPLSSMMGILELMDTSHLDRENLKLFSYLKPLTKELDSVIRQHSKKMSTFN